MAGAGVRKSLDSGSTESHQWTGMGAAGHSKGPRNGVDMMSQLPGGRTEKELSTSLSCASVHGAGGRGGEPVPTPECGQTGGLREGH